MCNDYEQQVRYKEYMSALKRIDLSAPSTETEADLPQFDDIRIGEVGTVMRAAGNSVELKQAKFGFPPPRPKAGPIFNFKSENRSFKDSKRCVIVLSGFYEFTGSKYPKAKHRFSLKGSKAMVSPASGARTKPAS